MNSLFRQSTAGNVTFLVEVKALLAFVAFLLLISSSAAADCRFATGREHLELSFPHVSDVLDRDRFALIRDELQFHSARDGTSALSSDRGPSDCMLDYRFGSLPEGGSRNKAALAQGFAIEQTDAGFLVTAPSSIGHLYATYDLLQQIGFRWRSPTDTVVPQTIDWRRVRPDTRRARPRFTLRGLWTFGTDPPDEFLRFLARNRLNVVGAPTRENSLYPLLGIYRWGGGHDVIPTIAGTAVRVGDRTLGELHPQWFGGSVDQAFANDVYQNPCFADDGYIDFFSEALARELSNGIYKNLDVINLWPSDQPLLEVPENCERNGTQTDLEQLVYFYSRVVERLDSLVDKYPRSRNVMIAGIGYYDTIELPPGATLPRDGRTVTYRHIFYPIQRSFRAEIESLAGVNGAIWRAMQASTQAGNDPERFGFTDYFCTTTDYALFHADLGGMDANLESIGKIASGLISYMHTFAGENESENLALEAFARLAFARPEPGFDAIQFVAESLEGLEEAKQGLRELETGLSNRAEVLGVGSSLTLILRSDWLWQPNFFGQEELLGYSSKIVGNVPFEMPGLERLGKGVDAKFDGYGPRLSIIAFARAEGLFSTAASKVRSAETRTRLERLALDALRARLVYQQLILLYEWREAVHSGSEQAIRRSAEAYTRNFHQAAGLEWPTPLTPFSPKDLFWYAFVAPALPKVVMKTAIGRISIYPEIAATVPIEQMLGYKTMCALARAVTVHAAQACGCSVSVNRNGHWTLVMSADPAVAGACSCQAICVDKKNAGQPTTPR